MAVSIQNVIVYTCLTNMSGQAHFCPDIIGHVQTISSLFMYLNPGCSSSIETIV